MDSANGSAAVSSPESYAAMTGATGPSADRTNKILVDGSLAKSFRAAQEARCVRLNIEVRGPISASEQSTVLTAVATSLRAFGTSPGVLIESDVPAFGRGFAGQTLAEACASLGASALHPEPDATIVVGANPPSPGTHRTLIWASTDGWVASIGPERPPVPNSASPWFVGIAAGAQAVGEIFMSLVLKQLDATHRVLTRNLWSPDQPNQVAPDTGVEVPKDLWFIGLGHLGQGFAWQVMNMPIRDALSFVLQDDDLVEEPNLSTGLLVRRLDLGQRKTRVVAGALERSAPTDTYLLERRLTSDLRRGPLDPQVVVAGVDNHNSRRLLSQLGATLTIDLALGARPHNFTSVTLRCLPDAGESQDVAAWQYLDPTPPAEPPAYDDVDTDHCGRVQLAGKAVGASFVGAFAGALAWSEIARRSMGGPGYSLIDIDLRRDSPTDTRAHETVMGRWPTVRVGRP